jgi:hypothetical protein
MSKRKIDRITGKPELTYREQRLVDEFFITEATPRKQPQPPAIHQPAPTSAYQVLRRPKVQRRIQQR